MSMWSEPADRRGAAGVLLGAVRACIAWDRHHIAPVAPRTSSVANDCMIAATVGNGRSTDRIRHIGLHRTFLRRLLASTAEMRLSKSSTEQGPRPKCFRLKVMMPRGGELIQAMLYVHMQYMSLSTSSAWPLLHIYDAVCWRHLRGLVKQRASATRYYMSKDTSSQSP